MTQVNWEFTDNARVGGYIVTATNWNDLAGSLRSLIDQTTSAATDATPLPIGIDLLNDRVYISDPDTTTPEAANHAATVLSVVGATTLAGDLTWDSTTLSNLITSAEGFVKDDASLATGLAISNYIATVASPAGSDGYIQYKNGSVFGGEAELFWDDTNNRLGVGTASPSHTLHVSGDIKNAGWSYLGGVNSSGSYPTAGNDLAVGWNETGGQRDVTFWNTDTAGGAVSFQFNQLTGTSTDSNLLTIRSNGRVGIGTTSPSTVLDVNGTATVDYLVVNAQGGSEGGEILLAAAPSGGANGYLDVFFGSLRVHDGGTVRMDLGLSTGDLWIQNSIRTATTIDGGMTIRPWTASSSYASLCTYNMTGQEYNLITNGQHTWVSAGSGGTVHLRPSENSSGTNSGEVKFSTSYCTWNSPLPVVTSYATMRRGTSGGVPYVVGYDGSSRRYKQDILPFTKPDWENIYDLEAVNFTWIESICHPQYDNQDFGLIAEDVAAAIPELAIWRRIESEGNDPVPDSVNYEKLSVYLLAALKDQNNRIKALEAT